MILTESALEISSRSRWVAAWKRPKSFHGTTTTSLWALVSAPLLSGMQDPLSLVKLGLTCI